MSMAPALQNVSPIDRYMLAACGIYIVAFLFLTRTMTFGRIEYGVLALALIVIALIVGKVFVTPIAKHTAYVDVFQMVMAGFVAVRYGLAFMTDLNHFVTLLLFVATMGFAVVFVLSIRQFISRMNQINPAGDETPKESVASELDASSSPER